MGGSVKTALVTGDRGFIGSQVRAALDRAGWHAFGVDVTNGMDARDYFRYHSDRFDAVVHCAAVVGGRKVIDWTPVKHAANLAIDAALFEWAERVRPGRVVYFSSSCAYPVALAQTKRRLHEDDIDLRAPWWADGLYGWAKLTGELLAATARDAGVPVSVVRPFSVYGPGMNPGFAVHGFLQQVVQRADPVEVWGNAEQVRDYIHVADVAAAVLAVINGGVDDPVNLGTGRPTSLAELVALMGKAAGYKPQIKVNEALPSGMPRLVADNARLRAFYEPKIALEDYLAGVLR